MRSYGKEYDAELSRMRRDVEKAKKKLAGATICENFGNKESRRIADKYFDLALDITRDEYYKILNGFDNWRDTYNWRA